jgi:hypothetical protein
MLTENMVDDYALKNSDDGLWHGSTNFPIIWDQTEDFKAPKSDLKQVPYWAFTNNRHHQII